MNRFLPKNAERVQSLRNGGVIVPFVLVVVIWSSSWYVIKDQVGLAPLGWTVAFRFLISTAGMALVVRLRGESLRIGRGGMGMAALIGMTQFCLNFQCVYRAEQSLTSGIAALMMALMTIPTALLSWAVFRTPLDRRFVAGSALAVSGIGLLLLNEYRMAPPGVAVAAGVGWGTMALFVAAVAGVAQQGRAARATSLLPLLTWGMAVGGIADVVFALASSGLPPTPLPMRFWVGVLYLSVVCSVLGFPLYFALIRRIGAARASYINVAIPVLAMGVSTVLEGYRWTGLAAAGAGLAMAGLVTVLRPGKGSEA